MAPVESQHNFLWAKRACMINYHSIISFYETCFEKHGDTNDGHHWPNMPDLIRRYEVMLDVIRNGDTEPTLLDFGCGTAMLYEHIVRIRSDQGICYSGLDLSQKFVEVARKKYPELEFIHLDILEQPDRLERFDYIVMNGVFTEKIDLSFEDMLEYFKRIMRIVFAKAKR